MATEFITTEDMPGIPAGTVITKIGQRYRNIGLGYWIDANIVENSPDRFWETVANNPVFWIANADGTTIQTTATNFTDVKANWFRSRARAEIVANRLLVFVRGLRNGA